MPSTVQWTCPSCSAADAVGPALDESGQLLRCACCGSPDLYRQKDFPQWLGMAFLAVACGLFFLFAIRYEYAIAWTILLGSAALDGLVYLVVGDVVVCYRCGAKHRGIPAKTYSPFELATAERYRQERLRREQLQQSR